MDKTEVTNAQFKKLLWDGYITTAEKIDWGWKKGLPENTQKPHDSLLEPSSLVFILNHRSICRTILNEVSKGTNWKNPWGPGSSIDGKENYPVVHISWNDAQAYLNGLVKDSQLRQNGNMHPEAELTILSILGNQIINAGLPKANTWMANFIKFKRQFWVSSSC